MSHIIIPPYNSITIRAPCKQMMPMIEVLEKEYAGKVSILKVNSDASRELAQSLSLRGVLYFVL